MPMPTIYDVQKRIVDRYRVRDVVDRFCCECPRETNGMQVNAGEPMSWVLIVVLSLVAGELAVHVEKCIIHLIFLHESRRIGHRGNTSIKSAFA